MWHVADLADCVLRAYSIARLRVPIGIIFKLFLGSMLVCFLLYAYIHTHIRVYTCTRPRARYNGQRAIGHYVRGLFNI